MNGNGTFLAIAVVISAGFLTACNPPASDQHLQEQAAQATEQAKQGSKEALADARVAAANAERAVNDVAAGVKQGIDGKPGTTSTRVDLNNGSAIDLAGLPGISPIKAGQIIHHRPYASTHDLVKNGLLTQDQFDQIASQITVH
jgi:DNA uptake protein ComE-like DNA-binding protein